MKRVHLVAGYLGAGKTTQVERMLEHLAAANAGRVAVVVGEAADLDVDGWLLHERWGNHGVEVVGVTGASEQPSWRAAFVRAVAAKLESPDVDTVIVEAPGLHPAAEVVADVERAMSVRRPVNFGWGSRVGVVDAARLRQLVDDGPDAPSHLEGVDDILLTRLDRVEPTEARVARAVAKRCWPSARLLDAADAWDGTRGALVSARPSPLAASSNISGRAPIPPTGVTFWSRSFVFDHAVAVDRLAFLVHRLRSHLLRLKGIVRVDDDGVRRSLQWRGDEGLHVVPLPTSCLPSVVVAVGRDSGWAELEAGLEDCLDQAPSRRRPYDASRWLN